MDNILISGSQENAEVVDAAKTYKCDCGYEMQVACGIVLTGSIQVLDDGTDMITCPSCNGVIILRDK